MRGFNNQGNRPRMPGPSSMGHVNPAANFVALLLQQQRQQLPQMQQNILQQQRQQLPQMQQNILQQQRQQLPQMQQQRQQLPQMQQNILQQQRQQLPQMQQNLVQQHQQFLAQQQSIQIEQLQKQRLLQAAQQQKGSAQHRQQTPQMRQQNPQLSQQTPNMPQHIPQMNQPPPQIRQQVPFVTHKHDPQNARKGNNQSSQQELQNRKLFLEEQKMKKEMLMHQQQKQQEQQQQKQQQQQQQALQLVVNLAKLAVPGLQNSTPSSLTSANMSVPETNVPPPLITGSVPPPMSTKSQQANVGPNKSTNFHPQAQTNVASEKNKIGFPTSNSFRNPTNIRTPTNNPTFMSTNSDINFSAQQRNKVPVIPTNVPPPSLNIPRANVSGLSTNMPRVPGNNQQSCFNPLQPPTNNRLLTSFPPRIPTHLPPPSPKVLSQADSSNGNSSGMLALAALTNFSTPPPPRFVSPSPTSNSKALLPTPLAAGSSIIPTPGINPATKLGHRLTNLVTNVVKHGLKRSADISPVPAKDGRGISKSPRYSREDRGRSVTTGREVDGSRLASRSLEPSTKFGDSRPDSIPTGRNRFARDSRASHSSSGDVRSRSREDLSTERERSDRSSLTPRKRQRSPSRSRSDRDRSLTRDERGRTMSRSRGLSSLSPSSATGGRDLTSPETNTLDDVYDKEERDFLDKGFPLDDATTTKDSLSELTVVEDLDETPVSTFTRSCPADLFFSRNRINCNMEATSKMVDLENKFENEMNERFKMKEEEDARIKEETNKSRHHHVHHLQCCGGKKDVQDNSSSSSSSDDDDDDDSGDDESGGNQIIEEWEKRRKHPQCLHPELWFNLHGQANDGLLCRCSIKSRQSGIRHDIYPGEAPLPLCEPETNNLDRLFHYRITMSPYTNFLTKVPTLINHDDHEYIFEGFSLFSHVKLENTPPCKVLRFNIEYTISLLAEDPPENFTIRSVNLFNKFLFTELLELVDLDWTGPVDNETGQPGCNRFHFLPRFCRTLPDSGGKEMLSMNTVLAFLMRSLRPLVESSRAAEIMNCSESMWQSCVEHYRGMIAMRPGMRPTAVRVDQLDRKVTTPTVSTNFDGSGDDVSDRKCEHSEHNDSCKSTERNTTASQDSDGKTDQKESPKFPLIIHQGLRPAQLSYAGDPTYRKAWKQYVRFKHLLNSKPKVTAADKTKLKSQEERLRDIRTKKTMKREVIVEVSSEGFLSTGLRADLCQHALMVPVLMGHLRFHICLGVLEDTLGYKFEDRNLLQLALTHTSYRTSQGTNPDHTRNSLHNCGMRQLDYGDKRIHFQNTRKRGICILMDIMSRMAKQEETMSEIPHNERLEFLGDAVIELLSSVHLFYMFPWLDEGGLTTYRMALVQNQHLSVLAKKLKLQDFMLYVHGPDLCHEADLKHAMANCCEAVMGALFLDGGLEVADRIFSHALFDDDNVLLKTWKEYPRHVLQHEEPGGDRHWVKSSPILQKLETFEESIGVKFTHIRLLAKAFTHRNIGVNPLTRGHNQRLEFLGDTVLQLVASEYLYRHYPEHHEGHLSLLRSSLVNSRTQAMVYDDLGMSQYVIMNEKAVVDNCEMKTKQRADILESFVGALYVDKDLDYCRSFCNICFFPRLKDFILNQDWNDPKSQLQQCCLTLREVGGGEPDIPIYKVIESIGPTNTRKYAVAVYFRGKRLAKGIGHNIQQAEMDAATEALKRRADLFPILQHQRRFLQRMRHGEKSNAIQDGHDNRESQDAKDSKDKVSDVKRSKPSQRLQRSQQGVRVNAFNRRSGTQRDSDRQRAVARERRRVSGVRK